MAVPGAKLDEVLYEGIVSREFRLVLRLRGVHTPL